MMNYLQGFNIPVVAFKEAWNVIDGDGDGAAPAGSIRCVDVLEGEIEETLRPTHSLSMAMIGWDGNHDYPMIEKNSLDIA